MMKDYKMLFRSYFVAVAAFVFIFSFVLYAFFQTKSGAESRRERLFEARTTEMTRTVQERMNNYLQILRGARALFHASDTVTREDWKKYYEALNVDEHYPGIQAIAYAVYVEHNELEKHLNVFQKADSTYKIKPLTESDFYVPIVYIEPFGGRNLRAYGFDMASEAKRRETIEKAKDLNKSTLSGKVTLIQETGFENQPGFLLYVPLFLPEKNDTENSNPKLHGFVYSPFRAFDVFDAMLKDNYRDLDIKIYDGETRPDNLLYHKNRSDKQKEFENLLTSSEKAEVLRHEWTFVFSSTPEFGSLTDKRQPYLILGSGFIVSLLLSYTLVILIRSRRNTIIELEKTKGLERKKDEFLAMASHELKTPLTSVKAYVQLLERHFKEKKQDMTALSYITRTNNYVDKLNLLISDLLDSTKIKSGKLLFTVTEFKIDALVQETVDSTQLIFKTHKIIKEGTVSATVRGDKQRIEQVLLNLLSNAVKYSPNAREVIVRIKEDKKKVTVSVIDQGVGIPKYDLPHIFDRFYRVEKNAIKFSGLGLGLYISHEIITRHEGKLWVESNEGNGSSFHFCLPLYKE